METKTLVQELQDIALSKDSSGLDVLRLPLYVSRKLKQSDFEKWVDSELNGYADDVEVPEYRKIPCQLRGLNHIRREWQLISFESVEQAELFSRTPIGQALGEIEKLSNSGSSQDSMLMIVRLHSQLEKKLMEGLCPPVIPQEVALHIDSRHVMGIVDKVKNLVLKWTLDLEDAGITGKGRGFTDQEKESAKTISITNHIYHGECQAIGLSMENSQIMQASRGVTQTFVQKTFDYDTVAQLAEEIKQEINNLGLTLDKKSEAEAELETLRAQIKSPKPKNLIINETLHTLRTILEGATAGVASGIVLKISGVIG